MFLIWGVGGRDLDHIRQRVLQAMDNPEFPAVPGDVTKFPSAEEIWKHVRAT
jgi:hypothetical protein